MSPALALIVCALLLAAFQHLSRQVNYHAVSSDLRGIALHRWALALVATACSYVALVGRDWVGLRDGGVAVPRASLWLGGVIGSALGNAAGFGALTGGAVRCRVYGAAGVTPAQVGRLTVLTGVTLTLALLLAIAVGAFYDAAPLAALLHVSPAVLKPAALLVLAAVGGLFACCGTRPCPVRVLRFSFDLPTRAHLAAQIGLALLDVASAAGALWAFLPAVHLCAASFLTVYAGALLLGMIGHTPGGIGVFESVMVLALGGDVGAPTLIAALVAYRLVYFALPLLLSAGMLAVLEGRALHNRLAQANVAGMASLVPLFISIATFLVGSMLVVSGALPALIKRIAILRDVLPLWMLESAHMLSSIVGVLLLFVARGLLSRIDGAWWAALVLSVFSLVLSMMKGLAFVEAGVLALLVAMLAVTRHRFDRNASLFAERFTVGWFVSVAIVLSFSVWVMFFAFRDVPYRTELWWQFAFDERAPRALRAMLGTSLFAAGFAFWLLLRPARGRFTQPSAEDLCDAERIVRAQAYSDAVLAMMGDKSFLFSASRRSFLMYAKHGRTWAALHDPVGPRDEWEELIGRFVALAHQHGGRAAFYQVRADSLPLYLDAGLTLMKLGEEARITLDDFDLTGARRASLRYATRRAERDGCEAEVIDAEDISAHVDVLRAISDDWRRGHAGNEKGFSVAAFNDDYLAAQSVMLVRQNGVPVAFTTFMTTDLKVEATVGVMRHRADASAYAMDYLFTQLALHLKRAGYRFLSLGVAPFSGVRPVPLGSPLHRVGCAIWRFGGRFYNFQGLRAFKGKFQPCWEPRYLAASGWVNALLTLADLSMLAGGRRS